MSGPYDDILYVPHPTSKEHPRMSMSDRAAQFSPYAALSGYRDLIIETARLTEDRAEQAEDILFDLDRKLRIAAEHPEEEITVTYFQPDSRKNGGAYKTVSGYIRKMDEPRHSLILSDGTEIPIDRIYAIEGELFEALL